MFFIHFFFLLIFLTRLNAYIPKHYESNGHPIYLVIAFFLTILLYSLSIILICLEYYMKFKHKGIMMFLVFGNCILEFYINSFYQFQLYSRPERYDTLAISIILTYFACELIFTFYVIDKLYKSEEDS